MKLGIQNGNNKQKVRKLRSPPLIDEERIMWVGKKEKCLILMFHFGQGVRCPGKD